MAEAFLRLSGKDRLDALGVAADRLGRPAHLLEKDVWVVWAIQQLFGSPIGTNLVFKGGTSLSKAYQVIDRFSEDVDLTFDIRALIPDLLEGREDAMPATSSEERRWSKRVRQALPEWVAGTIQPILQQAIDREGIDARLRIDGDKLFIEDVLRFLDNVLQDYIDHGTHEQDGQRVLSFDRDVETAIYNTLPDNLDRLIRRHPLKCPVAFLGGLQSAEMKQVGMAMTEQITKGRISMVDGSHLFPMEKPLVTAAAIEAALLNLQSIS